MRCVPLAYVVQQHIKVMYIMPQYRAYLNLGKEMIVRALIVDTSEISSSLKNVLEELTCVGSSVIHSKLTIT